MLPFDYCCSSVKKELRKRTCQICNQYIPSAYRMKNHYKIHAQHYDDFDHDQDEAMSPGASALPATTDRTQSTESGAATTAATTAPPPVFKTEMLDWLRSDFDDFDLGPTGNQLASDRVTRSMKKLNVEEKKGPNDGDGNDHDDDEEKNSDWVHVE